MKVLDLRCAQGHGFEGWFASGDAFESQRAAGHVDCPVCGEPSVTKLPTAPRLSLSGAKEPRAAVDAPADDDRARTAQLMHAMREIMARTEDVGERFAEEARKMHYGDAQERGIRGRATRVEVQALAEEGIDATALVLPDAFKQTLQ